MFKIFNQEDFGKLTKGIKVAQCMRSKSSVPDSIPTTIHQLDDLTVSDSLSCSFCNTIFEDQTQQRLHYKLDWHRYNLKQRLRGFKSISEDEFGILLDGDNVSSLSGMESDPENADEADEISGTIKNPEMENKSNPTSNARNKIIEKKLRMAELMFDSSDSDNDDSNIEKKKTEAQRTVASRHSKVFFENEDKNIFSIYRCLLHNKKEIPEIDNEIIAQALASGNNTMWTIIMLGGGHFAAAVFKDGEAIAHKTFHSYTVRAKQGSSQSSRDNRLSGGHCKSAGASLRRYNEITLLQHIQEILESWSTYILNSSLILYRAVGPQNRTVLFGGKNPPLDRNDTRLRPLPFPTKRATFNEVKRVYDILSTIEVYGSAADFTDSFPISSRQVIRKKNSKVDLPNSVLETDKSIDANVNSNVTLQNSQSDLINSKTLTQVTPEKSRSNRSHIDRAKPRKSPSRPLPDIITKLAKSSSESEADCIIESNSLLNYPLIQNHCQIEFSENLLEFEDMTAKNCKQRKIRKQRKKTNKNSSVKVFPVHKALISGKSDLWRACKIGDYELLMKTWKILLDEVAKCEASPKEENLVADCSTYLSMSDVILMINEGDEDGNTMLHLAANGHSLEILWQLLEIGIDPCKKNKKLQTAYVITSNKEVRNTFRRFMAVNPNKFDYNKSQIPAPLTPEMEEEELEKKRHQRKVKREREKLKKKEFELKKKEAEEKQRFLNLPDREKRALEAERRIPHGSMIVTRCFQCGTNTTGMICFEYNSNRFCSMPCLKEHRLHNKFIL
ncbi:hypothetical protein PV328_009952 [Microctonus aethiopoides]|uniref:VLRF1 domain-containing protein n=1 Tax=Microctonus aethiopoides TaxID=144406 RepID=A0AA39C7T2_9HYME|nr:hypothetical protein PV328_009952 [Microctonus aethiopoides]